MANVPDAVIELGSSDEETTPAPKKLKLTSNAMVHIPANLDNITIKPVRPKQSNLKPLPKNVKQVQFTKVQNVPAHVKMPFKKYNTAVNIPIQQINRKPVQGPHINPMSINPVNIASKLNRPQLAVNKLGSKGQIKRLIPLKNSKTINLPPSITVTKTCSRSPANIVKTKQQIVNRKPVSTAMPTVDIADDEESSSSPLVGPQWYLRPEQVSSAATTISKSEEENNKEPKTNLIEITIDDSPVKNSKVGCFEVGIEYPITIEDSPLKLATNDYNKSSDEETSSGKVRNSKKKLDYPIQTDVVEIELEPLEINSNPSIPSAELSKDVTKGDVVKHDNEKQDLDGRNSTKDSQVNLSIAKKDIPEESEQKVENDIEDTFNSTYQTFINLCLKLEDTDDMKKIVEKKIKGYHRQVPREFTESEEFNDIVQSKIVSMRACPEKMYLYIKDVVDELNTQRKLAKSKPQVETKDTEAQKFLYGENSQFDHKKQRQIRKLEKALKKLHRVIKKLEEQEVDFDDDEDSVYLLTESDDGSSTSNDIDNELERNRNELLKRYKERMVRVHAKLCQLTNTKMPSEPHVYIAARPGHNAGPAKKLEKWVNRKIPIGAPLPFPDFHDVLQCVREANEEDKLGWNEATIKEEAQDLFTRCGKILQRRRQENEWRLAVSRISSELDPADESEELKKKLDENRKLAAKREAEVLNKFADRQKLLKLEAEEIGDKEANESPGDDDEDDDVICEASTSFSNKVKRKSNLDELVYKKKNKTESQNRNKDDEILDSTGAVEDLESTNSKSENVEHKDKTKDNEEIDLLSSEDMVSSDIDELHLLQKLKSDIVYNSSPCESQTDIVISDTTESDNVASNNVMSKGVISIENSSYSESDTNMASKENLLSDNDNVQEIDECRSGNELSDDRQENENENLHNEEHLLIALSDDEGSNQQMSLDNGFCNLNDANNAKPKINNDSPPTVNIEMGNDSVTLKNKEDEILSKKGDHYVHSVKNDNVNNIVDAKKLENNEKSILNLNTNGNEDAVMTEHRDDIIAHAHNYNNDCSNIESNSVDIIMSEEVSDKNSKNSDTPENQDIPNVNDPNCGIIETNNTIGSPSINKSGDYSKNENKVVDVSLIDKEDALLEKQDTEHLEKSLENNEGTCSSQLNTEVSKDVDMSGNDKNFDMEIDTAEEEIKIIGFESLDEEIYAQGESVAKMTDNADINSVKDSNLLGNSVLDEKVTNTDGIASLNCEIVLKEKGSKDSKQCSKKIEDVEEDGFKKVEDTLDQIISWDL